ncbi:MAG: hypothetical protein KDN22_06545 [Verrucomicrobiae bacterium]|nr:hypothetical protein [Verrucomicrobiae bacterium]
MIDKRLLLLTLASLYFLNGARAQNENDIEPGKETYTAKRAVNPIVLDGDLSEWTGANLLADPRFYVPKGSGSDPNVEGELVNFEIYNGGDWNGPDDHTSNVRVVYDDDNVYFGFVVTDEYHENSANSAWNGDSVQLMIANAARDAQVALYNYALGGVEDALGDQVMLEEAGPGGTSAVVTRNTETKRTTYEICLPKASLELDELKGGVQFGLGMAINDGDEATPGQRGWGGLGAHALVFGKSPSETALVTLADPAPTIELEPINDIEPGKEFYTAVKTVNPIVLDGDLSEWGHAQLLADPRFSVPKGSGSDPGVDGELVNFEIYNGGDWTGPDDQTSTVRVVYDDDNIYFGFVVTDEYHENSANSAWNGDSVQLMIANAARDAQVALYNYALGGVEDALGDQVMLEEAGPGGTSAVVTRNTETKRTTYEICLPKASLELDELTGGVQFGLGMAINDGDEATPGQKGWGGLGAHALVFGKSPSETALVTLATANDIEPGKEYYSAGPTPGAIVLDGDLSDWERIGVLSDPRFAIPKGDGSRSGADLSLFEPYNGGTWDGPDDQTSAVRIAYDEDNVYFAFVVTDDYHENSANSAWNGDSVQLMIANDKQDTQIALYNYALGGVEDALGDQVMLEEAGPGGTSAFVTRDIETKRTTYEIQLPKESLGLDSLKRGTMFGLGMAINDGDEATPGQKGWGGLGAHALVFGKSPEQTALVTLNVSGDTGEIPCFVSAFSTPTEFNLATISFRGNDFEQCIVDPATTRLFIDGVPVELVASEKKLGAIDFTHTLATPFETGSVHTYRLELRDTAGNVKIETGEIVAPSYGILTPEMKVAQVNTTKQGFIWRVFLSEIPHVAPFLDEAEQWLSGELGEDNYANPELFGPALSEGIKNGSAYEFEIPTVINLNVLEGDIAGNFEPDDQMPGVPGVNDIGDGASAEIICYVEFPAAGLYTFGVNSDDGFRMEGGPVDQPDQRVLLDEFPNSRGAADSIFGFEVKEAGVYPIRVIWWNGAGGNAGTGGANIELFSILGDGTRVLLNDTANGGLRVYRSAGVDTFNITEIAFDAGGNVVLKWNSRPGVDYAIDASPTLGTAEDWQELDDGIASEGASTQSTVSSGTIDGAPVMYFRVREL